MAICRKFRLALACCALIGCASIAMAGEIPANLLQEQCQAATYGTLDIKKIPDTPDFVAMLLLCALRDVVYEPTTNQKQYVDKLNKKKIKMIESLLEKKWQPAARDEFGNTILMAMVMSYLPIEWRLKKVPYLIKNGCDLQAKNSGGKTALALAQIRNEKAMIDMLTK